MKKTKDEVHLGVHTEQRKYFYCDWPGCEKKYTIIYNLTRHRSVHSEKRKYSYSCEWPGCDKSFFRKYEAKRHLFLHTGERPYHCNWRNCDEKFSQKATFDRHIFQVHKNPKNYICDICDYICSKKVQMATHIINIHNKNAKRKSKVKKTDVKGKQSFIWPYENCAKNCLSASKLKIYLMSYTGERPYPCNWPNCDKKFSKEENLNLHLKIHNGQHFPNCKCQDCEKKLKIKNSFKRHVNNFQSKDNLKKIYKKRIVCQCPNCQSFNSGGLTSVNSAGTRLHNCHYENCSKVFDRPTKLKKHLEKHTEKSFISTGYISDPCHICGYRFLEKDQARHLKAHKEQKKIECSFANCPTRVDFNNLNLPNFSFV